MSKPSCSTPERDAIMRRDWQNLDVTTEELLRRLNALPGPPISAATTLYSMTPRLGLPRSRYFTPIAAKPPARRPAASKRPTIAGVQGQRGSSLVATKSGPVLPAHNDDQTAAEEYFALGWFARQVAAELRIDVGLASTWYFAWKKRQDAAERAA